MSSGFSYVSQGLVSFPSAADVRTSLWLFQQLDESLELDTTVRLQASEIVRMEAALGRVHQWLTDRRMTTALQYTPKQMHCFIPTGRPEKWEHFMSTDLPAGNAPS